MNKPQSDQDERLRQALLAIRALKAKVEELQRGEPCAIVGIGCRVPGASSPEALWQLVREGRDATSMPSDERRQIWDEVRVGDLAALRDPLVS